MDQLARLEKKPRSWLIPTGVGLLGCCAVLLLFNLLFMFRLDTRQERFLDYGKFQGQYESERTVLRRDIVTLGQEIATQRAWVTSVKSDLGELVALIKDVRQRDVIQRMIDSKMEK